MQPGTAPGNAVWGCLYVCRRGSSSLPPSLPLCRSLTVNKSHVHTHAHGHGPLIALLRSSDPPLLQCHLVRVTSFPLLSPSLTKPLSPSLPPPAPGKVATIMVGGVATKPTGDTKVRTLFSMRFSPSYSLPRFSFSTRQSLHPRSPRCAPTSSPQHTRTCTHARTHARTHLPCPDVPTAAAATYIVRTPSPPRTHTHPKPASLPVVELDRRAPCGLPGV